MKITFLGTGGSLGVPVIGCHCAICRNSSERLRSSILIEKAHKKILIDAGPDIRRMALKYHIEHLDGVLITHTHYDHIGGLDDLTGFCFKKSLPCLLSLQAKEEILFRYPYLFEKERSPFEFHLLPQERGTITFAGLTFTYMTYSQKGMPVKGFRFDNFAYLTDIKEYPETLFEDLKGLETLVVGALTEKDSKGHFTIKEALAFARSVGAKRTLLTHISHGMDIENVKKQLPSDVDFAYDGLIL